MLLASLVSASSLGLPRNNGANAAELVELCSEVGSGGGQTTAYPLATIRIDGRDVGNILISEHLARQSPDGVEWSSK